MFRLTVFRWAGITLVLLGMTTCVSSLSAQDTARIKRWLAALQDRSPDHCGVVTIHQGNQRPLERE
jgi:hypothetical protein